jgi:SAM-dependent methyltransferase
MSKPNEWQEFFNHYADQYDNEIFVKNTERETDFLINELELPVGASILDMGCGTGRHAVALANAGFLVTGIDISGAMLDRAQERAYEQGVKVTWVQLDAKHFKAEQPFDAAICLCEGALCLLGSGDDPYTRDMTILRNIHQSLKPGGQFIVTALNACRLIRAYDKVDMRSFDPITMVESSMLEVETPTGKKKIRVRERLYTPAEFVGIMRQVGFVVEAIYSGTAGGWKKESMNVDEMEFMVIARKE